MGFHSNLAYAESLPTGTHFGRPRCFALAWQSGRDGAASGRSIWPDALSDLRQRGLNTERRQAWNAGRRHRTYEYCLPFMAGQSEELRHTR
jgi:hypothetical protein